MPRGEFAAFEQVGHITHPHPLAALPFHQAELAPLPSHPALARELRRGGGAQRGHHVLGQPLAQGAVFGVVEVDLEQLEHRAFVDQQHLLLSALYVLHAGVAPLVRVQLARQAFVEAVVGEGAEVLGDEPDLVVDQQGTQRAVMAVENRGDVALVGHGETPSL